MHLTKLERTFRILEDCFSRRICNSALTNISAASRQKPTKLNNIASQVNNINACLEDETFANNLRAGKSLSESREIPEI